MISKLVQLRELNNKKGALVPIAADLTIYFADVDKIPAQGFEMNVLLTYLADQFNQKATRKREDVSINDFILTKRKSAPRHHIYIPATFGKVTKDERKAITIAVNAQFENDFQFPEILDPQCSSIRIEGFLKYDTKNRKYLKNSAYAPMGDAKEMTYGDLLDAIWIDPVECTPTNASGDVVLANLLGNASQVDLFMNRPLRGLAGPDNDDNKEASVNNTQQRPSMNHSRASTPDTTHASVPAAIVTSVRTDFPMASHKILQYPVINVKKGPGGHSATFMCDKSEDGRRCLIAKKIHKSNNIYLYYNKSRHELQQRCYGCPGESEVIFKAGAIFNRRKAARAKELGLPSPSDMDLAAHFMLWKPHVLCTGSGKNRAWYIYEEAGPGYWQRHEEDYIIGLVLDPFKEHLRKRFRKAIEDSTDNDEAEGLERDWALVAAKLSSVKDLNNMSTAVRFQIKKSGKKIRWNQKEGYTVFPNGVLQWDKTHEEYPELPYFFGPTKPEDYINDDRCWETPFNCPPVCFDGHYIHQAEQLQQEWIDLVQPEADDKCLLLMFLALTLLTVNYKKMILNIGPTGDNAKSSFFEMCVFLMGTYGIIGDKRLIVKGAQKDRVSKAMLDMVRFILFEEPDPSKTLDVEFIKVC